jgi:hypothetical protein
MRNEGGLPETSANNEIIFILVFAEEVRLTSVSGAALRMGRGRNIIDVMVEIVRGIVARGNSSYMFALNDHGLH